MAKYLESVSSQNNDEAIKEIFLESERRDNPPKREKRPVACQQLTDRDKNNSSSNRMNVCRDEKSFKEDPNTARAIIAGLEERWGVKLPMEQYKYFLNLMGITGVNEL